MKRRIREPIEVSTSISIKRPNIVGILDIDVEGLYHHAVKDDDEPEHVEILSTVDSNGTSWTLTEKEIERVEHDLIEDAALHITEEPEDDEEGEIDFDE